MKKYFAAKTFALTFLLLPIAVAAADDDAALYRKHCAQCHDEASTVRAPRLDALRNLSADQTLASMSVGSMKAQATALSEAEKRMIAEFVTGKKLGTQALAEPANGACHADTAFKNPSSVSGIQGILPLFQ